MLRRNVAGAARLLKILTKAAPATKWRDALRSRPLRFRRWASNHQRRMRPRRSVALQITGIDARKSGVFVNARQPPQMRPRRSVALQITRKHAPSCQCWLACPAVRRRPAAKWRCWRDTLRSRPSVLGAYYWVHGHDGAWPSSQVTLHGHDGAWPSRSPENMRAKRAQVPP